MAVAPRDTLARATAQLLSAWKRILLRRQHGGEVGGARLVLFCANLQRAPGRNGPAAQEVSWTRDCKKVEIPLSSSCCALSTPF